MRHQQLAYDWLMTHDHAGLFLGMGLGKTVTTLTALSTHLWDDFTVHRALVIAPRTSANNVWAQECEKWDHLTGIRCSIITGTAQQRRPPSVPRRPLHHQSGERGLAHGSPGRQAPL